MSISPIPSYFSQWFPASPNPSAGSSASSPSNGTTSTSTTFTTASSAAINIPTVMSTSASLASTSALSSSFFQSIHQPAHSSTLLTSISASATPTQMMSSSLSSMMATSCPREQQIERDFCRDFSCCGLVLNDLHELMRHCEEVHGADVGGGSGVDALMLGMPSGASPPTSLLMQALEEEDAADLEDSMDTTAAVGEVGVDEMEAAAAEEEAKNHISPSDVVASPASDNNVIEGFSFEMDGEEGDYEAASFAMDDASSMTMLALFPHLRSSPPPIDSAIDPVLTTASTNDLNRPATLPRIGSTDRFLPPSPPLTVSLADIYCETLSVSSPASVFCVGEDFEEVNEKWVESMRQEQGMMLPPAPASASMSMITAQSLLAGSNPASPECSSTNWSDESEPESDDDFVQQVVRLRTREEGADEDVPRASTSAVAAVATSFTSSASSAVRAREEDEIEAPAIRGREKRAATSASRRVYYMKQQYGGANLAASSGSSGSLHAGRAGRSGRSTLLSRAIANRGISSTRGARGEKKTTAAAEKLARATKRMRIGDSGAGAESSSQPLSPGSLDSEDEEELVERIESGKKEEAALRKASAKGDKEAARKGTRGGFRGQKIKSPATVEGSASPIVASDADAADGDSPSDSNASTPSEMSPAASKKSTRSRPLPVPKPSGNLQHLTPAQLAHARAKAEMLLARAVAGELAFNKEKLEKQLANQQVMQQQQQSKAAAEREKKVGQQAVASQPPQPAGLFGTVGGAMLGGVPGVAPAAPGGVPLPGLPQGAILIPSGLVQQAQQAIAAAAANGANGGSEAMAGVGGMPSSEAVEAALRMVRTRMERGGDKEKPPGSFSVAPGPLFFAPTLAAAAAAAAASGKDGAAGAAAGAGKKAMPVATPAGILIPGGHLPPTSLLTQALGLGMVAPPGFTEADAKSFALAMSAARGMMGSDGSVSALAAAAGADEDGGEDGGSMMDMDEPDCLDAQQPRYRLGSMRIADPETGEKKYVCPGCNKEYKNANGLKYHLNHVHPNGDGMPLGFLFGRKKRELEHAFKPFPCVVRDCGKRYKNLNGLKYHIIHTHTRILPEFGGAGGVGAALGAGDGVEA
ncbi:Transcriptional regulator of ribosomal biogenesis proteins [Phlyctochytrium planicorne]|nr:Transcriptional regulator of ribosomal biogenesis proteins [Phlyctochytrium planicorne]